MTLLDWIIMFVFLVIVILAHFAITPFALAVLVVCVAVSRVLRGERL